MTFSFFQFETIEISPNNHLSSSLPVDKKCLVFDGLRFDLRLMYYCIMMPSALVGGHGLRRSGTRHHHLDATDLRLHPHACYAIPALSSIL